MKALKPVIAALLLALPVLCHAANAEPDPEITAMIAEISPSNILATATDLSQMGSRIVGQPGNTNAAAYLHSRLSAIPGLEVEYQDDKLLNVIATLKGTGPGSEIRYVTGAHYDCASNVATNAPGATDNAAGVGVVMELARVLSKHKFEHSIVFAFWNAEEKGCRGSLSYADSAKSRSETIGLYINYDSTCFDPQGRLILDVISDRDSEPFRELLVSNNSAYNIGFTLAYNQHNCGGDHVSFRKNGYPALFTHQETHGRHYHTTNDLPHLISADYASRNARLGLTILTELARKIRK